MTLTRREFLAGTGALSGLALASPLFGRPGVAFATAGVDPATASRNRLVVIWLSGGNDGLNMVIPTADVAGAPRYSVYRQVRPTIAYAPSATLALDRPGDTGWALGLNPRLPTVHNLYRQGRVAVVQGVDYPNHDYSHFTSQAIWEGGTPGQTNNSGWLGRHLDRAGIGEGELRAVGLGYQLPLILSGRDRQGVEIQNLPIVFGDGTAAAADARHAALAGFGTAAWGEPLRQYAGDQMEAAVGVVNELETAPAPPQVNSYLAQQMLTARTLLTRNLGVECVYVIQGGYDTHNGQVSSQESLFTELDQAIELFLFGTMGGTAVAGVGPLDPVVASRTLLATTSEFGRRIGENSTGTDHGAAAPMLLVGPGGTPANGAVLTAGIHGDHPNMGTTLLPADNLTMTTDLRRVYQSMLEGWLHDPDPAYGAAFAALPGLFQQVTA